MSLNSLTNMQCKVCKSDLITFEDTKFGITYYQCKSCNFIFKGENYIPTPDDEVREYKLHDNTIENKGYVKMFNNFIDEAIDPFIKSGLTLDYGCGTGPVLSHLLKDKGFETKTYDKYFSHSSNYNEYKYDLITSTEVFEHFKNPLEDIKKITDLLKENGYLAVMTHLQEKSSEEFLKWYYRLEGSHISFYSYKTFVEVAKIFNLEIVYFNDKNIIVFKKIPV